MYSKISVLLVDDHAVVRTGYKTYLSISERIGEIYEADRGESACQIYDRHNPDVVVMDLSMPGLGGFECIRRLLGRHSLCKILVFSIHHELVYVTRAIKAGAKGYITKNNAPETLISAVCALAEGQTYIEAELAQKMAVHNALDFDEYTRIKDLSPREFDIFCLLASGLSCKEAAEKLCLSYKTVSNHSTAIKEKLDIKTMSELALLASRQGIVKT
ncbi:response regulator transcription factor [Methylomonas paludis]|uniref:Response regulator transcription factor n=1 Tax=Methylomonas paludis TaxID=1173101 RepID=A0A975MM88_9GAMM|nr:response regulator transcription factor [Methylomonas paludis]QWF70155.1 response regulator transcription factor [Methylomonas paludis]